MILVTTCYFSETVRATTATIRKGRDSMNRKALWPIIMVLPAPLWRMRLGSGFSRRWSPGIWVGGWKKSSGFGGCCSAFPHPPYPHHLLQSQTNKMKLQFTEGSNLAEFELIMDNWSLYLWRFGNITKFQAQFNCSNLAFIGNIYALLYSRKPVYSFATLFIPPHFDS